MKVKLLKFTPEPEKICAIAARLCYSSASIYEISEKFTKEKIKELLGKVISSGHNSVLEHASFTFGVEGVSRSLLAQLTRHRIASFSVQSQRYVKFKNGVEFVVPETIKRDKNLLGKYNNFLKNTEKLYKEFLDADIPAEDARYILPNASTTKIVITMNTRELRHFFSLRSCNRAQWEIRDMTCRMLSLVRREAPLLFSDAGPDCIREGCHEAFTCGKPWKNGK
ncbi:flavin-dependent thymidylate synthase [Endomicrobiia bacterium]|nr:flavin-dependent thymidylate synthase [Endomicrobiia bacterium]GHT65564.1 flavin-dependent thymidylate synthase [Endomicrobiia bacterium]GHT70882.1 flavin-dependent thymidylate synthase [Endomicrobiia bacterium]GHT75150.1 flavin-dependent thymidylate synthase [Endomicrobiia bacterium]